VICTKSRVLNGWKEIADYLGCHAETAMEWADSENLPYAKVKGAILTTTNAIELWIIGKVEKNKGTHKKEDAFL